MTEHTWDEASSTSSTLFWVIEEQGEVTRFGSQMSAWRHEKYLAFLEEVGFQRAGFIDAANRPVSETFEGKPVALLAQSAQ